MPDTEVEVLDMLAALASLVKVELFENEAVAVADVCVAVEVNSNGVEQEDRVVEEVTEVVYFLFIRDLLDVSVVYGAMADESINFTRLAGSVYNEVFESIRSLQLSEDESVAVADVLYNFDSEE